MDIKRTGLVMGVTALLLSGGILQGCGGEDFDVEGGAGKAEKACAGQFIAGTCYAPDNEIKVSFYAVSARLTKMDQTTDMYWDVGKEYKLPDPVVHMELYDAENSNYFGGRTNKYTAENVDSNLDQIIDESEDDFEINLEDDQFFALTMGPATGPMTASLPMLRDEESYLEVVDDDILINQTMGRCSLNPTDEELAEGIIVAKDCYSESEDGRLAESNILELKIRIKVENY